MRKYYPGITVFKLVGSLTVLLAHIKLPALYQELGYRIAGLQQMMAFVVPCFYIVAGFLACQGWLHARRPRHYITRYLTWVVAVYALFCLFYSATSALPGFLASYRAHMFSLRQANFLFEVFFVKGPSVALWFVPPLIFSMLVAYYFERRGQLMAALVLAGLGYLGAQLMAGTLRTLLEAWSGGLPLYQIKHAQLLSTIAANYLGVGLPFVLAGVIIAKNEDRFMQLKKQSFLLGTASLVVVEAVVLAACAGTLHAHPLVFSTIPGGILLFYGVLHLKADGVQAHHALINRFSALAYFFHIPFLMLNLKALGWQVQYMSVAHALVCAGLTLVETLLLTALVTVYPSRNKLLARPVAGTSSEA